MKRLWGLDCLRIVSMVAVVVIHTAAQYMTKLDVTSSDWAACNFYDGLVRWAVPIFVMISGVLFLNPAREQPLRKLYSKNVMRIVTIIVLWGFVYAAINHAPASASPKDLVDFIETCLLGHYHMWFLYMIAGLYIAVPILRCITASEKATSYFLLVAFVLNSVVPFIANLGNFTFLPDIIDKMLFQIPMGYSFYFVLGYWLHNRSFTQKEELAIYGIGILGTVGTIGLTAAESLEAGKSILTYYDNFSLTVCLTSIALFESAKHWIPPREGAAKPHPVISALSGCTLGVYLVHVIVLENVLPIFGLTSMTFNPWVCIPVTAAVTTCISFAITFILTKIPFVNKHFV